VHEFGICVNLKFTRMKFKLANQNFVFVVRENEIM